MIRKLLLFVVPVILWGQTSYVLNFGQVTSGGGILLSPSYSLVGVTGVSVSGVSSGNGFKLSSGMPYGAIRVSIEEGSGTAPYVFKFLPLSPNPSAGNTEIKFTLPQKSEVDIQVIDISGRLVWETKGTYRAGNHRVVWNGRSNSGTRVASGLYIVRFLTAGRDITRKLVVVR